MGWVKIAGVGPGDPDFITLKAVQVIQEAEIAVGSRDVLDRFAPGHQAIILTADFSQALDQVAALAHGKKIVILLTGDPGFFSLLGLINVRYPGLVAEVIPGISSVQLGFARLQGMWHGAAFYSLHGRPLPESISTAASHLVFILAPNLEGSKIRDFLLGQELAGNTQCHLMADLTCQDEQIEHFKLLDMPEKLAGRGLLILERC